MYSAKQIADWILGKVNIEKGDTISPLKLQKLLYYCQAWHYTIFHEPVFNERIEAWMHGPVVPSQYARFANVPLYGCIDIPNAGREDVCLSGKTLELLEEVMNIYGERSASYLEKLSHSEQPWKQTRGNKEEYERSNEEIPLSLMAEYYSSIQGKNEEE